MGAKEFYEYFEERFGIARRSIGGLHVLRRGKSYWVFAGDPTLLEALGSVESVGIMALNMSSRTPKPATAFLRIVGRLAKRNVARLADEEELAEFMVGGIIKRGFPVEPGYVIVVSHEGDVLGCGLYSPGLGLVSQIPKHMRAEPSWGLYPE